MEKLRSQVEALLRELLVAADGSRTTFRVDLPADGITVTLPLAEAVAPGVPSMMAESSLNQRGAPTAQWMETNRKMLIQNDLANADPMPPAALMQVYGAKAQMLAPVEMDGDMIGWVSVHYVPSVREWTPDDVAVLESTAARIRDLIEHHITAVR